MRDIQLKVMLAIFCVMGVEMVQAQEYTVPSSGAGPAVLLLSGISGVGMYRDFAREVAALGYTAILVDGKEVPNQNGVGSANLQRLVAESQADARVKKGKVAVVGFSLGGGGALLHAASLNETVSAVVAYYPGITRMPNISDAGRRLTVPTLVLAGEIDRFNNCCLIESVREFQSAAQHTAAKLLEVVAYPSANHGFNLTSAPTYRAADAVDAWARTRAFLQKNLPLE